MQTDNEPSLVAALCESLGVSRATFYRGLRGPVYGPQQPRRQPRALTVAQRVEVLAVLHELRFVDLAPPQVYARLLDEGTWLCAILDVPPARGCRGVLALVVAQLVAWCAASAQQQSGSTLTVRVTTEAKRVLVMVADNGVGFESLPEIIASLPDALGIRPRDVLATVALGQGCVFELYFDAVA